MIEEETEEDTRTHVLLSVIAAELGNIRQWWSKEPKPVSPGDILNKTRPVKVGGESQDSKPEPSEPAELTEEQKERMAAQGMMNKQLVMGVLGVTESG